MAGASRRKPKKKPEGIPEYMATYGDMVTLLLTFFILLISTAKIDGYELKLILANFPGLGNLLGGSTFVRSPLSEGGYTVEALPSTVAGTSMSKLLKTAQAVFQTEITVDQAKVTLNERGLVISLASDFYFEKNSANVNVEKSTDALRKVSMLLRDYIRENPETQYRIEGHTDENTLPIGSAFKDEWDLSAARSSAVLRFMKQFLLPVKNAGVVGFGNTKPLYESGATGNLFNRRVDIVILNEGNL